MDAEVSAEKVNIDCRRKLARSPVRRQTDRSREINARLDGLVTKDRSGSSGLE